MENAANVRAMPAVAAFDATDHLAEYGLSVPDAVALGIARQLVDDIAKDAQRAIGERMAEALSCGNPYRESVQLGGREVKFALLAKVFPADVVARRIEDAFKERGGARPDVAVLHAKIARELAAIIKPFGYELAGIEKHADGSIATVAVRDPIYAAGAAKMRGVELEVTRDVDFATALATVSAKTGDTGVRWVSSPEMTARVEQHIDELAKQAVEMVRNSLRGSVAGGNSPFSKLDEVYKRDQVAVVDATRVKRGLKYLSVPMGAKIPIVSNDVLMAGVTQKFAATDVTIDRDAFIKNYRETIARHLRANPDLRGAFIGELYHYFTSGSRSSGTIVFCGAEVLRPWYQRLLGIGKPEPLALPAPQPAAPKQVLVGPIEMPTR